MKLTPRIIAYATLLVHWGPSNALSYGWGFLIFLFILIAKPGWFNTMGYFGRKVTRNALYFSAVFFLSAWANFLIENESFNNLFWSIFTYGSTICTLLVFLSLPFHEEDGIRIFRFSLYLTLFEALVGYIQMLTAQSFQSINPFSVLGPAAGDNFVGTTFDVGIGNLIAIKMSLTVLLFIPFWFSKRSGNNTILLVLLLIGWILPSAIYTLLIGFVVIIYFFVVYGSIQSLFTFKMHSTLFYATVTGFLLVGLFVYTQRENVVYTAESLKQIYTTIANKNVTQASRKVMYFRKTITKLPFEHPYALFIGVGPGNYSSRSAWLVSGEYLEHQPFYIPVTPSKIMEEYNITIWSRKHISNKFKGGGSITHQPFSTWFSIIAEMGVIALIIFSIMIARLYQSFTYAQNRLDDEFYNNLALGLKMTVVYLVFLFFVDNLFEWPMVMAQFFVFAAILIRKIDNTIKDQRAPD